MRALLVALLLAVWAASSAAAGCDVTPVLFGCSGLTGDATLLALAVDNASAPVLPFEVVHGAEGAGPLLLSRWRAPGAATARLELAARTATAAVEARADDRSLQLVSPGGAVVLVQDDGATRITIDSASGCVRINGELPPRSPCRRIDELNAALVNASGAPAASEPSGDVMTRPAAPLWVVITAAAAALALGCIGGCFLGACALRKRLRPIGQLAQTQEYENL